MKINDDRVIIDIAQYIKARDRGEAAKNTDNKQAIPGDSVQISEEARGIASSRADNVARLKNLVETGSYSVAPDKVAASIIRHDINNLKKDINI